MKIPLYFILSSYFQWAGSILIAICCLARYSLRPYYIRMLGFYAVWSIIFQIAQKLTGILYSKAWNNPLGNGFVLFEAVLLGALYFFATQSTLFRKGVISFTVLYVAFYIFIFLFFTEYSYSYIRFVRDLLMIIYAIAYFYYLIRRLPEENLLRFPMFWINSAVIFFFSGTLVLSWMRDYIVYVLKDDMAGFWAFRNFFRFGFCLVLTYAGWLDLRLIQKSKSTSA